MLPAKKKAGPEVAEAAFNALDDSHAEFALDTLATVIRSLGEHNLDLAELQPQEFAESCDRWSNHLLSLQPVSAEGRPTARRDWAGVRRFVKERRQAEQRVVQKSMGDMRDVVSTFVQSINSTFKEEQQTDDQLLTRMKDFCTNIDQRTTEEIKRSAVVIALELSVAFERRKAKHERQLEEMGSQVDRLGDRLTQAEREKSIDPLTGLYNRRVLDSSLKEALSLKHQHGHPAVLAMLDVDRFKVVNDTHGHVAGDAVLKALGDALFRCFPRRSDVVVRFGGEEFAVLLSHTGESDGAIAIQRLQKAVRALEVKFNHSVIHVTVSVGVAELQTRQSASSWIEAADKCLYAAKAKGRDCVVLGSEL